MDLNLRHIDPTLRDRAREAFERSDADGILSLADNQLGLAIVADNRLPFAMRGIYEKALLHAFVWCRENNAGYPPAILDRLFAVAAPSRLREAGSPIPRPGPFVLYRGVSGVGRSRRIRGYSWTRSLDMACWFAVRMNLPSPAVYTATVRTQDVLVYHGERSEDEFICKPKEPTKVPISVDEIREGAERVTQAKRAAKSVSAST